MKISLKKIICSTVLAAAAFLPFTGTISPQAANGVWKQNNTGWWYEYTDSSYPVSKWLSIGDKWYYFDSAGYMAANKWIGDYYLGSDGAMLSGTVTPDGYTVDATGKWISTIARYSSQGSSTVKRISTGGSSGGSRGGSSSGGGSSRRNRNNASSSNAQGAGNSAGNASGSGSTQGAGNASGAANTQGTGNSTAGTANTSASAELTQLVAQGLSAKEAQLYLKINEYRQQQGLPRLSLSKSLTEVARKHVEDSNANHPENQVDARGIQGNLHSWSYTGSWQGVVYTGDHHYASLMWSKPSELTAYTGNGYEISMASSGEVRPEGALNSWKGSSGHNSVILGSNGWSSLKTMGVGIDGNYAHVWFGSDADPAGYYQIDNYSVVTP